MAILHVATKYVDLCGTVADISAKLSAALHRNPTRDPDETYYRVKLKMCTSVPKYAVAHYRAANIRAKNDVTRVNANLV